MKTKQLKVGNKVIFNGKKGVLFVIVYAYGIVRFGEKFKKCLLSKLKNQ